MRLLKTQKKHSSHLPQGQLYHQFLELLFKCHGMINKQVRLPSLRGAQQRERLAWEIVFWPLHRPLTGYSILETALSQLSDGEQQTSETLFFTLFMILTTQHSLRGSCQDAGGIHICKFIHQFCSFWQSFLPSQLQSNPVRVFPSLFQVSLILKRSELFFQVLAVYSDLGSNSML